MLLKKILIIVILCLPIFKALAFFENDPRIITERFYKCLQTIAEENYPLDDPNTEASQNARMDAINLCCVKDINLPNELTLFENNMYSTFLEASTYLKLLKDFAIDKRDVKYRSQITQTKAYEEIKAAKSENSTHFYNVYVKKTISSSGISKEFLDTVLVCVEDEIKIAKITNFTSTSASGENVVSLRGKAAELFSQKKYQEAYDTYLKVIKKDFKQGDAYYRLGLMAYHNLGCKNRFRNKSARLKQAYEYIKLAEEHGNYEIKEYARRVKYYMENGSV